MNIDAEPVLPVSGFSIQWCSWLGKQRGFVCESDDTMVSNQQGTRWIQLDPSCSLLLATFVLFSSSANKAFLHPIDIFGRNSEIHLTFQLWYWSPIHNSYTNSLCLVFFLLPSFLFLSRKHHIELFLFSSFSSQGARCGRRGRPRVIILVPKKETSSWNNLGHDSQDSFAIYSNHRYGVNNRRKKWREF